MSYWSHNPELYDEIIVDEMIRRGLGTEEEDPEDILKRWNELDIKTNLDVVSVAEAGHFGGLVDTAGM